MQLDYVLAFTQLPVKRECYMNITKVVKVHSDAEWLLKAKHNIYSKRQAVRVWNKLLVEKSTSSEVGFRQIKVYECVFYHVNIIFILYADNYILEGPDEK